MMIDTQQDLDVLDTDMLLELVSELLTFTHRTRQEVQQRGDAHLEREGWTKIEDVAPPFGMCVEFLAASTAETTKGVAVDGDEIGFGIELDTETSSRPTHWRFAPAVN